MKTQDEERWSQQVADLHADGEPGQRFLEFFTFWFGAAEVMIEQYHDCSPVKAMRMALEATEREFGFLTPELIGQMLVVATMHWKHGAEMAKEMTNIEHRVMEQALALKLADLQTSAAQE